MTCLPSGRRTCRRALWVGALSLTLALPTTLGAAAAAAGAASPATLGAVVARDLAPAQDAGALVSAAIVDPAHGRLVAGLDAGSRLPPSGVWPLVTAAAALWRLGPTARVETNVLGPAPRSGTVLGDLVLVGGGDPFLSETQIAALAHGIARRVKLVTGGVLADGALFTYPQVPAGWPIADTQDDGAPPVAALSVNGDAVTVTVTPAASAGAPATVREDPAGLVPVSGHVATVKGPNARGAIPVFVPGPSGVGLSGSIAVGAAPVVRAVYPSDPGRLAATLLRHDLARDGVTVQGGVGTGLPVAGSASLAHVLSPPLSAWLPALWSAAPGGGAPSPLTAENLFRLLCGPSAKSPCGIAADRKEVLRFLAAAGAASATGVQDGSGLALTDSASAQTLAQVLQVAGLHAWGAPLLAALPPLDDLLPGAPKGAMGVYAVSGGALSLLARVPAGTTGTGERIVAFLAAGLYSPSLASASALAVVDTAHGLSAHPPKVRAAGTAAAKTVLGTADGVLVGDLNQAGPGSETAVTAWPVGARAPAVNLGGAALLPATGIVPLFVAARSLPGASSTTRLTTRVVVDGTLSGSTLNGSIGLVGGLDPTLGSAALATLAQQVAALGVRRVTGGVAVDDLALPPTVPATWPWQWLGDPPAAGGDALSAGEGLFSVAVLPGRRMGASPTVEVVPASTPVGLTDEARTVSGGGQTLALWPDPASGRLVLTGTIGLSDKLGTVFLRVAPDPGEAAGRLFLQDLRADGVAVAGAVRRASIPSVAPLLARVSGPSLVALDDALLASPTPAAAWDAAAIAGGALRGVIGPAAVDAGLAATASLLVHDGAGAPAPVLTEPVGVGSDDRLATYDCAATLAALARASGGTQASFPSLLPVVPTTAGDGALHAVVGVGTGAGSLAGYFVPTHGRPVAVCVSLSSLTRDAGPVLPAAATAAAHLALAAAPPAKAKTARRRTSSVP